jgi:hypothetical protein
MNGRGYENTITSPYPTAETPADEYNEQAAHSRELDIIETHYGEDADEPTHETSEQIEPYFLPEREQNPQMAWPEGNPDNTIEEDDYSRQLDWRLTGAAFMLDSITDTIKTDADAAAEWAKLKQVIAATKKIGNVLTKVGFVIEIEKAVYEFAAPRGATYDDYVGGRQ